MQQSCPPHPGKNILTFSKAKTQQLDLSELRKLGHDKMANVLSFDEQDVTISYVNRGVCQGILEMTGRPLTELVVTGRQIWYVVKQKHQQKLEEALGK